MSKTIKDHRMETCNDKVDVGGHKSNLGKREEDVYHDLSRFAKGLLSNV